MHNASSSDRAFLDFLETSEGELYCLENGFTLEEWAAYALEVWPRAYADPPLPDKPSDVVETAKRVRVMRRRRKQGRHLYHPGDAWRKDNLDKRRLKILIQPRANGSTEQKGVACE